MVMPTKVDATSHKLGSSCSLDNDSFADLQLRTSSTFAMTVPRYPRTIHMASQYYFLPVDEGRYDQRWVCSPFRSRAHSNPTGSSGTGSRTAEQGKDDLFEVLCQKVTAVHDETDDDEDDDIEFTAVEYSPPRSVSMSNSSTLMDDETASNCGSAPGDPSPQQVEDDKSHNQLLMHDVDISDTMLDQDFETINFEVDEELQGKSSLVAIDSVDEMSLNAVADSCMNVPSSLESSVVLRTKDDESSEYEDDEVPRKQVKKRRLSSKKASSPRKKATKSARKTEGARNKDSASQSPLRALSAYNFFFRDERERLLYNVSMVLDDEKCDKLLSEHWNRDRTQKRRHRKTHGKIPFTQLSKIVSSQWKKLTEDQKDFYRGVSAKDWARYQRELEEYKIKQEQGEEVDSAEGTDGPCETVSATEQNTTRQDIASEASMEEDDNTSTKDEEEQIVVSTVEV